MNVLLVEDNADSASALCMLLELEGHRCIAAHTLGAAVEAAAAEPFTVLISDLNLPDGSGLNLPTELSAIPNKIAVSGDTRPQTKRSALDAGFESCMAKPLDFDALLKRLAELS